LGLSNNTAGHVSDAYTVRCRQNDTAKSRVIAEKRTESELVGTYQVGCDPREILFNQSYVAYSGKGEEK
jgi:hypothetical protein